MPAEGTSDDFEETDKPPGQKKSLPANWKNLPALSDDIQAINENSTDSKPTRKRRKRDMHIVMGVKSQDDVNLIKAKIRKFLADRHGAYLHESWTKGYTEHQRAQLKRSIRTNFCKEEGLSWSLETCEIVLKSIALDRSKNDEVSRKAWLAKRGIVLKGRQPKGHTQALIDKYLAEKKRERLATAENTKETTAVGADERGNKVNGTEANSIPQPATSKDTSSATEKSGNDASCLSPKTVQKTQPNGASTGAGFDQMDIDSLFSEPTSKRRPLGDSNSANDKPDRGVSSVQSTEAESAVELQDSKNEATVKQNLCLYVQVGHDGRVVKLGESVLTSQKEYVAWAKTAFPEWNPETSFLKMLPLDSTLYSGEEKTANFIEDLCEVAEDWDEHLLLFYEPEVSAF